jgi:hypothetical protein
MKLPRRQFLHLVAGAAALPLASPLARSAGNMPPVISTIVMLRLFARRQRASMSAYFTNSLTPPTGLGLLASLRGGSFPGRAARGSVAPRKMACRPPAGDASITGTRFKAIGSR